MIELFKRFAFFYIIVACTHACQSYVSDPVEACVAVEKAKDTWHDKCSGEFPTARSDGTLHAICEAELSANGMGFSVASANDCITSVQSASGDCRFYAQPPCIQHGTLANGGACAIGMQCASGYCDAPNQGSCGTCADIPIPTNVVTWVEPLPGFVGLDGACDASRLCDWQYWCDAGHCRPRVAEGHACVATYPGNPTSLNGVFSQQLQATGNCESLHLVCDGVCKRKPSSGDCLNDPANNVLAVCDMGSYCDINGNQCKQGFKIVSVGESCQYTSEPVLQCEAQSTCAGGTCKKLGGVREPCGVGCETGLQCDLTTMVCGAPSYSCP